MLSGEDFGYLKDGEQNPAAIIAKKALLLGAVLFSLACFVYITVSAYYFSYHDKDSDIEIIKSPAEPIKIIAEAEGVGVKDTDKTIYDNIVGNRNLSKENFNNIKVLEQVTTPLVRKRDPDLVLENLNNNSANKPPVVKIAEKQKVVRGLSRVQVAALSSKSSASKYWSKLNSNYPNLMSNLNHFISEVYLGEKGTFYRLQIGNFKNQVEAEEFCHKFIAKSGKTKADCIIVE